MAVIWVANQPVIDSIRFNPGDMIGRDLNRRLRTLEFRARMSAGFKTGRLRERIKRSGPKLNPRGLEGQVGSSVRYAAAHHEGARPHIILPRKPGGTLRFRIAGRVVFARRVNHPGNKPNRYLSRHLREAVR